MGPAASKENSRSAKSSIDSRPMKRSIRALLLVTVVVALGLRKGVSLSHFCSVWRRRRKTGRIAFIRQAKPGEGSWITLAFDPKGRIVVAREDKGLLRMTLDDERQRVSQIESINSDLLECRSLLFAHNSLYVSANNSLGIYRLKDSRSDGVYDDVKL